MRQACSPPLASWLVLFDNDWRQCEVDRVRVTADDGSLPAVHGFNQICPGRHLVKTVLPSGTAVLDTLVYPGQMHAFALDREAAAWVPIEGEDRVVLVESINACTVHLYPYFDRVAMTRFVRALARPRVPVLNTVCRAFAALVSRLASHCSPASPPCSPHSQVFWPRTEPGSRRSSSRRRRDRTPTRH